LFIIPLSGMIKWYENGIKVVTNDEQTLYAHITG
jgi:hypothetical protein